MTIDNVQALTCVGVEEMETVSIGCSIGFNREGTSGKEREKSGDENEWWGKPQGKQHSKQKSSPDGRTLILSAHSVRASCRNHRFRRSNRFVLFRQHPQLLFYKRDARASISTGWLLWILTGLSGNTGISNTSVIF
jgi:hypothetical protein